jgi:adenine/guanine phosphoribosyltransferase-like PRPP-binding protein
MQLSEYLGHGEKILIIDDFLATGATILGLAQLPAPTPATNS